jgi:hypothetical protein
MEITLDLRRGSFGARHPLTKAVQQKYCNLNREYKGGE